MSKYFKPEEFACKCCGEGMIVEKLESQLDLLRSLCNRPLTIVSGYRCGKHNKEVGGVEDSAHMAGLAVDIKTNNSRETFELVRKILKLDIAYRIGVAKNFVHIDVDNAKPQNVMWIYK